MQQRWQQLYQDIVKKLSKYPREYYVVVFFGVIFLFIVSELFSFTVMNNQYYKALADRQQTSQTSAPISRWTIFSSNEKWNVLAVWVDLNDLAIDPQVEWSKPKLIEFLTDVVYNELCYLKSPIECRNALTKFLWLLEIPDFRMNEWYLKQRIQSRVEERVNRDKVTSVLLRDNLSPEQAFDLDKMNLAGVYVNGVFLYINPEEISDRDFIAGKLVETIGGDFEQMKHFIRQRPLRYSPILNKLSITTSEFIKQKIDEEKQALSRGYIEKEDMVGWFIILTPNPHRLYPERSLASQVLWFVNSAWDGVYGVEGYFNNILKWKQTQTLSRKDTMGRTIDPFSFEEDILSTKWANITLTIDRNVQKAIEDIIDVDIFTYQANKVSVVVMNPKTWAIIAMASHPRVDLNSPGDAYELVKVTPEKYPLPSVNLLWARVLAVDNRDGKEYIYDGKKIFLREIEREEYDDWSLEKYVYANRQWAWVYRNETIQDLYEPGSVLKAITTAIGIDTWEIDPFEYYRDEGSVKIDRFTIRNASSVCTWYHTFQHALDYSCNVWMIRIAQRIWTSLFHKYLESFGFWKKTWITLEWETTWRLDSFERWSQAQLFTTSFGQWITSTMLQMAASYSVLANGGVYVKPQIVKQIEFPDGRVIVNKKEETHRVIKESTAKIVTDMLVNGVEKWFAKNAWVAWYRIAWKTWTSQIAYKWKYEDINGIGTKIGSFGGYAPAEDPRFVMIVKVDRPRIAWDGWSATAAVTFSKISQYLFNYYGIPKR